MNGNQAYALAKKYTDDTMSGTGSIQGKNCTITNITHDTTNKVNKVTFSWTEDDGTVKTQIMSVPDGIDGANGNDGVDGLYVKSATINSSKHLILTLSDNTTTIDAGLIPEQTVDLSNYVEKEDGKGLSSTDVTSTMVSKWNSVDDKVDKVTGKGLSTNDYDATAKAKVDAIPSDPKYTDTVYDDTAITQELANIYDGGFASRNLFDKNAITPNVKYATDGTTVGDANWGIELIKVEPNTKYAITSSTATGYFIEFDSSKTFIKGYTKKSQIITTSSNCEYLGVGIVVNSTLANYDLDTFQIEKGDVATSYQPYAKSNVELTHATNDDLKMLGWTVPSECHIQNYTDANGVFHQRVGRVDLGTLFWTYDSSSADRKYFYAPLSGSKASGICYTKKYTYNGTSAIKDKQVMIFSNSNVIIKDLTYTDATTFKSAMSGVYLYYELATEITKSDGNEIGTNLCGFISPSKISSIQVDANWDSSNRTISYTATENCFVVGRFATNGTNLSINVKIDDYLIQRLGHVVTNAIVHENTITIPLRKGQVFKIEVSITNGSTFASLNAVKMI